MWKWRSCPRCNGDMYVATEREGESLVCLQCGHERPLSTPLRAQPEPDGGDFVELMQQIPLRAVS